MAGNGGRLLEQNIDTIRALRKCSEILIFICMMIVLVGGVMNSVEVLTIVWRGIVIFLVIRLITWLLLKVIATYEEINRG